MTAAWQVEFLLVPRAAATGARAPSRLTTPEGDRAWSASAPLPRDFLDRLPTLGLVPPARADAMPQTWGAEEGNQVEVSAPGEGRMAVRIVVGQLDARFAAALLGLVRAVNGILVRSDGLLIDGTVGAFSAALRSTPAWRFVSDPTGLLTGRPPATESE